MVLAIAIKLPNELYNPTSLTLIKSPLLYVGFLELMNSPLFTIQVISCEISVLKLSKLTVALNEISKLFKMVWLLITIKPLSKWIKPTGISAYFWTVVLVVKLNNSLLLTLNGLFRL